MYVLILLLLLYMLITHPYSSPHLTSFPFHPKPNPTQNPAVNARRDQDLTQERGPDVHVQGVAPCVDAAAANDHSYILDVGAAEKFGGFLEGEGVHVFVRGDGDGAGAREKGHL